MSHPHEGKRIKRASDDKVYLVLDGVRRHIPSMEVFNAIFSGWNIQVWPDEELEAIPEGDRLWNARLGARGPNQGGERVYLHDIRANYPDSSWRHIISPEVFHKYDFAFYKVQWNLGGVISDSEIGPDIRG